MGNSDLVQESMAIAVEKFDQFEGGSEAELFAWVKTILENQIRQARRAYRSEKRDVFRERSLNQRQSGQDSSVQHPLEIADRELTPLNPGAYKTKIRIELQNAMQKLTRRVSAR